MRGLVFAIALVGCDQLLGLEPVPAQHGPPTFVQYFEYHWQQGTPQPPQVDESLALSAPATLCIVTISLGNQAAAEPPAITSVTYDGTMLSRFIFIQGIHSARITDTASLTEQWYLASPQLPSSGDLSIVFAEVGQSMHMSAMFFTGVSVTQPIDNTAQTDGDDISSQLEVATAPGELVESVTGQGTGIEMAGSDSMVVYEDDLTTGTSLDNTWGSITRAGSGATTMVSWSYQGQDLYQTVGASLRSP